METKLLTPNMPMPNPNHNPNPDPNQVRVRVTGGENGDEAAHSEHAEVGDGEGAAHLARLELAWFGSWGWGWGWGWG